MERGGRGKRRKPQKLEKSDKRVAMERDIGYESETELNRNVMTDAMLCLSERSRWI